jgi:hypothetical protein
MGCWLGVFVKMHHCGHSPPAVGVGGVGMADLPYTVASKLCEKSVLVLLHKLVFFLLVKVGFWRLKPVGFTFT